jgi:flagellar biosynthetic protein FlhB
MNPVTGLKKIFSKKGLVDILKLILKVVFFSIALLLVWHQVADLILYPTSFSLVSLAANWKAAFTVLVSSLLVVFALFAMFDLWHSKKEFANKMRMSTNEEKEIQR